VPIISWCAPASVAPCSGCHGVDGNSRLDYIPRLSGLNPTYFQRQMQAFRLSAIPCARDRRRHQRRDRRLVRGAEAGPRHAADLRNRLQAFADGDRTHAPPMDTYARHLSADEIAALAAYLETR